MSAVIEFGFESPQVNRGVKGISTLLSGLDREVMGYQQRFSRALKEPWVTAASNADIYLKKLQAMDDWNQKVSTKAAAMQSSRSGRGMALGGAAMQVQDIAVQLQMGTKLTTVIAQQGSQMLSAFGAGGAILGGLVAVGGAFVTMGQNARTSLDTTISGARDLRLEVEALAQVGTLEAVRDKLTAIGTSGAAAFTELNQFTTLKGGLWTELLAVFGGPSGNEKFAGLQQGIMAGVNGRVTLKQRLLDLSAQELEFATLKAAGDEEGIARKQREITLAQELAAIQRMNISGPAKDQMAADATARSALSATTAKDPKKTALEIAAIQKSMEADRLAAMPANERYFELADLQAKTFARMDQEGGAFFDKSVQGIQEWATWLEKAGKQEELLKVLKLMQEISTIQKAMDEAKAANAVEMDARQKTMDAARAATEKQRIDAFAATLQQAPSAAMAQRTQPGGTAAGNATEAHNNHLTADGRRTIYSTGRRIGMGGGLDQHFLNQQTASKWEMLQRGPSAFSSLQNGVSQLDMGLAGQRGATATASRNADRQDRKPADPTSILSALLDVTKKGLLGG